MKKLSMMGKISWIQAFFLQNEAFVMYILVEIGKSTRYQEIKLPY